MSISELMHRVHYALSIVKVKEIAFQPFSCPLCGPSVLLRLIRSPIGVRCMRCGASAITLSMVSGLQLEIPGFEDKHVYELSSRGPLFEFLMRHVSDLTYSEYFDGLELGGCRKGIQCQDVQRLTFADSSFDLITSTEVFEHVPDDRRGFSEIRRVLRPGGAFIFTVPLADAEYTVERAVLQDNIIQYPLPAIYHDDRIRGRGTALVYRDYGRDITLRLREAGFISAHINSRFAHAFLGQGREVVVATR